MNFMKISYTIVVFLLLVFQCNSTSGDIDSKNDNRRYLEDKGFKVIKEAGEYEAYTLSKEKLTQLPYMNIWGLQNIDIAPYINKRINSAAYVVVNEKLKNKLHLKSYESFKAVLMIVNGKNIGGYLLVVNDNLEQPTGNMYSLAGESIEEVNQKEFKIWQKEWLDNFSDS